MNRQKTHGRGKVYELTQIGVMTAVICVLAPLSIPIGTVPISFTNLAICLALYILGWKKGTLSFLCYLVIGMAGVPVFSGFTGGVGKLLGPTGGYIIGFIPLAIISGLAIEKSRHPAVHFIGMVLGVAVCYTFGTAWFCYEAGVGLNKAMSACVIPFIPGDLLKIVAAMLLGPAIRKGLQRSGLIE